MQPGSSAKTTSAIETSTCRDCMGDTSELSERIEEALDEIALCVKSEIKFSAQFAVGLGRDHRLDAAHGEGFDEAVGVVTLVGDESLRPTSASSASAWVMS
jgi:hypothetical protein